MYCEACYCQLPTRSTAAVSAAQIIELGSKFFGVAAHVLVSKHRPQNVVDARFMIIAAIRERLRLPVKRIGQLFNRDHTSVLHAIKTVQNLCHTDAIYRQQYKDFKQFINDKI